MKPPAALTLRALMLPLLLLLAAGCATPLPRSALTAPRLPPEAAQPTPPPICSPTCSAGLTRLRTESLDLLIERMQPDSAASAPTGK